MHNGRKIISNPYTVGYNNIRGGLVKTKGRFIGILAVLSLLIAMLPMGSVGAAVAGTAALSGGVVVGSGATAKTYYSDQTGFNVVTATVTDADLSPLRTGQVRFANVVVDAAILNSTKNVFVIPLSGASSAVAGVIAGEASKIETLDNTGHATSQVFTLAKPANDRAHGTPAVHDGVIDAADVIVKIGGVATTTFTPTFLNNTITAVTILNAQTGSVAVTDGITIEYVYTDYSAVALNIPGSSVTVFKGAGVGNETTQILDIVSVDSTTGTVTVGSGAPTVGLEVVINFSFEVVDVKTKLFTVSTPSSVSLGKSRLLTGTETGVSSDAFANSVALFSAADLGRIETEAANAANDGADTIVSISELNTTGGLGTPGVDSAGTIFLARIEAARVLLNTTAHPLAASASASELIKRSLPVADGEKVTVTYIDSSPAGTIVNTQNAIIDLVAPVTVLQTPTHKLFTSVGTQQMLASVSDSGSGLVAGGVTLVKPAGAGGDPVISLNTAGGFDASLSPTAALTEGAKSWYLTTVDRVGNVPTRDVAATTTVNEGALGSSPLAQGASDNPFKFTVDTTGPTAIAARTGVFLKNPGVTATSGQEVEKADYADWVRFDFSLGTGGAPIDPATVSVNDFTVGGIVPTSVFVNAVAQTLDGTKVVGSAIYLQVPTQATNATPSVQLVGSISDKAGNARTTGTKTAADKLSPILTVTTDLGYSEKNIVITVTSSETLSVPPTVVTRPTVTVGTTAGRAGTAQTVQSTALTTWTTSFANTTAGASKQWIVATGSDSTGNQTILGDSLLAGVASTADVVTFQVDDAAPAVQYPTATGTATEGDVWIVVRYDEDEHGTGTGTASAKSDDTHRAVTVKTATLNGVDVSSEVFIGTTTGAVNSADAAFTQDTDKTHATVTLAKNLPVGTHKYVIVVQDDALNASTSFTHTLTVTAKAKISIVLNPGVNLVSIPGNPVGDGGNLNTLFGSLPVTSVVVYDRAQDVSGKNPWLTSTKDAETGLFTGDVSTLAPGAAYFITATARTTAKVLIETASMQLPPSQQVLQGWNAIGYSSISGATGIDLDSYLSSIKWSVAYTYNPTPGVGWTVERASQAIYNDGGALVGTADVRAKNGEGWLVFVTEDGTLTP